MADCFKHCAMPASTSWRCRRHKQTCRNGKTAMKRGRGARRHRHDGADRRGAGLESRRIGTTSAKTTPKARQEIQGDPMTTVWVYVDTVTHIGGAQSLLSIPKAPILLRRWLSTC